MTLLFEHQERHLTHVRIYSKRYKEQPANPAVCIYKVLQLYITSDSTKLSVLLHKAEDNAFIKLK